MRRRMKEEREEERRRRKMKEERGDCVFTLTGFKLNLTSCSVTRVSVYRS